jgi:geranylgeranyl reductase family protein
MEADETMDYDAVIIGAGPAGSHLAFLLACAGVNVAMVDRAVFPRDKLCGGLLTHKTLALLEKAHPGEVFPFLDIKKIHLTYKRHYVTSVKPLSPIKAVCRHGFDALLVKFAEAYGSHMYMGTSAIQIDFQAKIVLLKDGRKIRYGRLIGADGALSRVRRLAGIPAAQLGFCLEAYVPWEQIMDSRKWGANGIELILGDFTKGYGWVFPNRENVVIGAGNLTTKLPEAEMVRMFPQFIKDFVKLEQVKFRGAYVPSGTSIMLGRPDDQDMCLIGDAAGLIDPLTGEGIYYALLSAEKAANAFLSSDKDFFSTYCRYMQDSMNRIQADVWVRNEFYHPFIIQDVLGTIQGAPQYIEKLVDETIIRYEKPYRVAYEELREYERL